MDPPQALPALQQGDLVCVKAETRANLTGAMARTLEELRAACDYLELTPKGFLILRQREQHCIADRDGYLKTIKVNNERAR